MKIIHTLLISSFMLSGCIDSGSDKEDAVDSDGSTGSAVNNESTVNGRVADGYLVNAKVCLDLNANGSCDVGEPSVNSSNGGEFSINATQKQIDESIIVVEVIKGETIDEDFPNDPLMEHMTLTAPIGETFVSPISTMIQALVKSGIDIGASKDSIKEKLGFTGDIYQDYVAGKEDGSITDEEKVKLENLHKVAQVIARVISANQDDIIESSNSSEKSDVLDLISSEVIDVLDKIVEKVNEAPSGTNFDPDAVSSDINDEFVDVSPENIEDKIEIKEAVDSSSVTDLLAAYTAGLYAFSAEILIDENTMGASYVNYDHDILVGENLNIYEYDHDGTSFTESLNNLDEYLYPLYVLYSDTETRWVQESEARVIKDNGDNTVTMEGGSYPIVFKSTTTNLEGISVSAALSKALKNNAEGTVGMEYIPSPSDVFPEGSLGYLVQVIFKNEMVYGMPVSDCDAAVKTELNGYCNSSDLFHAVYPVPKADDLSEIVSGVSYSVEESYNQDGSLNTSACTSNFNGLKVASIALADSGKVLTAELVFGGSVNFYFVESKTVESLPYAVYTSAGSGTWSEKTVGTQVMYEIDGSNFLAGSETFERDMFEDDHDDPIFIDGSTKTLFELGGMVRVGWGQLDSNMKWWDNDSQVFLYNKVAADEIIRLVNKAVVDDKIDTSFN